MSGATASPADRTRFEQLFIQTRVAILGYLLRRCGDPGDAADLLAETYLTAWRRIHDVPDGDQARPWLFGVARYTLANHRRHQHVENRLAATLRAQLPSELDRVETHSEHASSDTITDCLAVLSSADREIIELAVYDQLSPAEIAVVTDRSAGAIRVRLHRIRRTVRLELLRAGYPAPGHLELARTSRLASNEGAAGARPTQAEPRERADDLF